VQKELETLITLLLTGDEKINVALSFFLFFLKFLQSQISHFHRVSGALHFSLRIFEKKYEL
jgi:hypothetical protein